MDGLELWDVFFLFAGIAVGMVLQGELAVLFLYFLAGGGRWKLEISICEVSIICPASSSDRRRVGFVQ